MNDLSMSKAHLALGALEDPPSGCIYPFKKDVPKVSRAGRPAQVGSLVHKLAECHLTGESVEVSNVDPSVVADAMALFNGPLKAWLEQWRGAFVEVGIRYDSEQDMSEMGPRRGEPGYDDHGAMVLKGTLDLARIEGGVVHIVDLKSGAIANAHKEQLISQAVSFTRLPIARTMGVKTARVGFAFARKARMPEVEYETLDEDRLDEEAGKIRRALRMIPEARPTVGKWCHWCDARFACPAWQFEGEAA